MGSPGSVRSARQCRLRDHGSLPSDDMVRINKPDVYHGDRTGLRTAYAGGYLFHLLPRSGRSENYLCLYISQIKSTALTLTSNTEIHGRPGKEL